MSEHSSIRTYYEDNQTFYDLLWSAGTNGMHFGYYPNKREDISHDQAVLNLNDQVARRLNIKSGARLLDCGCGVGGTSVWMARKFPQILVDGISIVPSQVSRAKQYASQSGVGNRTSFSMSDFNKTGLAAAQYDGVFGIEAICYANEKRDFLAEAFRVMKPGGRLSVMDGWRTRRGFDRYDEMIFRKWARGWAVPDLDTAQEFQDKARSVGFTDVRFENLEEYIRPSHMRVYRMARLAQPLCGVLNMIGLVTDSQYGNLEAALCVKHIIDRGLAVQGVITASKPLVR